MSVSLPVRRIVVLVAVAASLAGCEPSRREIDAWLPEVSPRDDGGDDGDGVPSDGDVGDVDAEVTPPTPEIEDNDPFHGGAAQAVEPPLAVAGTISTPGSDRPDLDVFSVSGTAGMVLRVTAFPRAARGPDLAVRVVRRGAGGEVVWERVADDPGTMSAYRDAFLPETGEYLVVVSDRANFSPSPAAWRGGPDYGYEVSFSLFAAASTEAGPLPWAWTGSISPAGLLQLVRATPESGARVEAILRTSDPAAFDPLLTVYDPAAGAVIAEDDDTAGGADALVRVDSAGAPLWFVVDHATADGRRSATLELELRTVDPGAEAEPNDGAAAANRLGELPATATGTIAAPVASTGGSIEDRDVFRFTATTGAAYAVEAVRDGGSASALDPFVRVLREVAGTGRLVPEDPLALADDSPRRGDLDARLVVVPRGPGTLFVEVRDARNVAAEREGRAPSAGGPGHRYVLRVAAVAPPATIDLGMLDATATRDGTAAVGGSPDRYRFAAPDGTPLRCALLDRSTAGPAFAPLAYLTDDPRGTVLRRLAPDPGASAASHVFVAGPGGVVVVGDAHGAGGLDWDYRLELRPLRAAAEAERAAANDTRGTAQALAWDAADDGVVVRGALDRSDGAGPDGVDFYRVAVAPGTQVAAFTGPADGDAPDTVLALWTADGTRLAENDDLPGSETLFSAVEATAPGDGAVIVEVSLWSGGVSGGYALFVGTP